MDDAWDGYDCVRATTPQWFNLMLTPFLTECGFTYTQRGGRGSLYTARYYGIFTDYRLLYVYVRYQNIINKSLS